MIAEYVLMENLEPKKKGGNIQKIKGIIFISWKNW
jgi:hypothetical protein